MTRFVVYFRAHRKAFAAFVSAEALAWTIAATAGPITRESALIAALAPFIPAGAVHRTTNG